MSIEKIILYSVWTVSIILVLIIPRPYLRNASISFLFQHFITWFIGLLVVQWKLIEYPVRTFANVNSTSFTFEFLAYPTVAVYFNMFYPNGKPILVRFLYYSSFCTVITVIEVILEKHTNVINYICWHWSVTWITIYGTLFLLRGFYSWFFLLDQSQNNRQVLMEEKMPTN